MKYELKNWFFDEDEPKKDDLAARDAARCGFITTRRICPVHGEIPSPERQGPLSRTREALVSIRDGISMTRFWYVAKIIAQVLAFNDVDLDAVTLAAFGSGSKFGVLRECFVDAQSAARARAKKGEPPEFFSLHAAKAVLDPDSYAALEDGIEQDLSDLQSQENNP